jgi:DNA topoisomerase-2
MSDYQHFGEIEHVLKRTSMYAGSPAPAFLEQYVPVCSKDAGGGDDGMICKKKFVHMSPALYKIVDELLVNALDQSVRDSTLKTIKVTVDATTVEIFNDGVGIPLRKDSATGLWNPHLIFGVLRTSSNYDDSKERFVGGMNGLGSKLANILSGKFEVECTDGEQKYHQVWSNHMQTASEPRVKSIKAKATNYVRIKAWPDLSLFGVDSMEEIIPVLHRRVLDLAALRPGVKVVFNQTPVKFKSFAGYAEAFLGKGTYKVASSSAYWDVVLGESQTAFQQISFVNGVCTYQGGTHVEHVASVVIKAIVEHLKKLGDIKPYQVRDKLFLMVSAKVPNPTFQSQVKECLVTPAAKFKEKFVVESDWIKRFLKNTGVGAMVADTLAVKKQRELAKTDGTKTSRVKVENLDDAHWAGTRRSKECSLIICEGKSARTFCIAGLSVVGRERYGVYPLKGKPLSARSASQTQILANKEITDLKTILGLKSGKTYDSLKDLRYHRLLILADSDVDGKHIAGLVLSNLDALFPGLLQQGFACNVITPILKAFKGGDTKVFFTQAQFDKAGLGSGYRIKYYKGLGTSTSEDAREIFRELEKHTIPFAYDAAAKDALDLAFDKTKVKQRKEWIQESSKRASFTELNREISLFVKDEMVQFSLEDCKRSLPHAMDGLKPSQRKILFTCLRRSITKDYKVAQLGAAVADHTHYHHGEASLIGAIVGMAQTFLGSNQVPLLAAKGQFGSRLEGGADAASGRYIFTHLSSKVRTLFPESDDALLPLEVSDGVEVEPTYYAPTLPMALINGCQGIGTGFSCLVPQYALADVRAAVEACLEGREIPPLHPKYEGFKGTIVPDAGRAGFYDVTGAWTVRANGDVEVTELPVGMWTKSFRDALDKASADYTDDSTESDVRFVIKGVPSDADVCKRFGLKTTLSTCNMYLFGSDGQLKRYAGPADLVKEFVEVRLALYAERKRTLLKEQESQMSLLREKRSFLEAVMTGALVVFRRPERDIVRELREKGYKYVEQLTSMPVKAFDAERIASLDRSIADLEKKHKELEAKTPRHLWKEDLRKI